MTKQGRRTRAGCDGFTLVEVLAALAIASVIIIASATLIRNVAIYFDRGTRGAIEAERLILAVDRLAGDFGSTRFLPRRTADGAVIAFTAEQESSDRPASVVFVGAGGVTSSSSEDELVNLTIERDGELRRLVRRRATWPGGRPLRGCDTKRSGGFDRGKTGHVVRVWADHAGGSVGVVLQLDRETGVAALCAFDLARPRNWR